MQNILKRFSWLRKKVGNTQNPVIQTMSAASPPNPNRASPRSNLNELQQEFDFLTSVVKRLGLWSVVWGQGMALWFFHQAGYLPHSLVDFALISIESIAIMAVSAGFLLFIDLLPLIYGHIFFIGSKPGAKGALMYGAITLGYGFLAGYLIHIFNNDWKPAIFSGVITAALNLLFYVRNKLSQKFVLYAPFLVPPSLLVLFVTVPPLPNDIMSYVGELKTPTELLISKKYKLISRVEFACKLDYMHSPSPLYYAFSGTTEISTWKGNELVSIPGTLPINCRSTFTIPERFLLNYNPPPPAIPAK
jgi:hypothetical protein